MNYLVKVLPSTAEICKPLQNLTSLKCDWTWNSTQQNLYNSSKNIIKRNLTMAFYNEKQQLYLETDALGVSLGQVFRKQEIKSSSKGMKHQTMQCCSQWLSKAKP